jgi:hypothetical protein
MRRMLSVVEEVKAPLSTCLRCLLVPFHTLDRFLMQLMAVDDGEVQALHQRHCYLLEYSRSVKSLESRASAAQEVEPWWQMFVERRERGGFA